jgi:hypothetical protein
MLTCLLRDCAVLLVLSSDSGQPDTRPATGYRIHEQPPSVLAAPCERLADRSATSATRIAAAWGCPGAGVEYLLGEWSATERLGTPNIRLELASSSLLDRRLLGRALSIAENRSLSSSLRVSALAVVAAQLVPGWIVSSAGLELAKDHAPGVVVQPPEHRDLRFGGQPLTPSARSDALSRLSRIADASDSQNVRRAASWIERSIALYSP